MTHLKTNHQTRSRTDEAKTTTIHHSLMRLPLMMEVEVVVLECGIMVFGLLRNLLFDVCVNCGAGVFEALCGK